MRNNRVILQYITTVFIVIIISGCISTEAVKSSSVIDDRPMIKFEIEGTKNTDEAISIYINNLYMGNAQDYLSNDKYMKIIPGTHALRLETNNKVILSQKIYIGEGSTKTITINLK